MQETKSFWEVWAQKSHLNHQDSLINLFATVAHSSTFTRLSRSHFSPARLNRTRTIKWHLATEDNNSLYLSLSDNLYWVDTRWSSLTDCPPSNRLIIYCLVFKSNGTPAHLWPRNFHSVRGPRCLAVAVFVFFDLKSIPFQAHVFSNWSQANLTFSPVLQGITMLQFRTTDCTFDICTVHPHTRSVHVWFNRLWTVTWIWGLKRIKRGKNERWIAN